LDEVNQVLQYILWGSYDGTTNAPIIYPDGTSILNMENQVMMQITPNSMPTGTVSVAYYQPLGVIGGQAPYTFSELGVPPALSSLPTGLVVTNSPSAAIVGVPTEAGTFDFIVRLSDSSARVVDKPFSITILP
jgi:hypothetical protein